ncbi:MAG: hypothetical protein ACYCV4_04345 [Dermatophilaceae bacterium]
MNDPDRRQTSDGFDHDAMFADIVAHWSDSAAEPEPVLRSADGDPADGDPFGGGLTADETAGTEVDDDQVDDDQVDGDGTAGQLPADHQHWPTGPPPNLSTPSQAQAIPAPQAWRAHEVDDEYEEHFEPPPVAPLPAGDLQFWAIIVGMCGGPLLLLYLVFFNRDAGSYWMLTAIAMSVGGFALLVARLPRDHEDDDDGARL